MLPHIVDGLWPRSWQGGCRKAAATWSGGPWFAASAGAFSAASSPSGLWGLHISPPFSCKDCYDGAIMIPNKGGNRKGRERRNESQILIWWKLRFGMEKYKHVCQFFFFKKKPSCDHSPVQKKPCNDQKRSVFGNWTAWRIRSLTSTQHWPSLINLCSQMSLLN